MPNNAWMTGVFRSSLVVHEDGVIEVIGSWRDGEQTVANAKTNLELLRSKFPFVLIATNDEIYRSDQSSRHHRHGLPPGVTWSGGVLPEVISQYEHLEVDVDLGGCWSLDKQPESQSILIAVGQRDLRDFLLQFTRNVWPISYVFMFADTPPKLRIVKEVMQDCDSASEFVREALGHVKVVICMRESEFAFFTRSREAVDLIPVEQ